MPVLCTVCVLAGTGACVRAEVANFPQLIPPFFILLYFFDTRSCCRLDYLGPHYEKQVWLLAQRGPCTAAPLARLHPGFILETGSLTEPEPSSTVLS